MTSVRAFLGQRCREYRDFQIAFTLLTANFFFPAISYAIAPEIASEQVSRINEILGGGPYGDPGAEVSVRFWRFLGAANVMTLALMCFLMQLDLRKYFVVLLPLTFLKAYNAGLFFLGWVFVPEHRAFLAISVFDFLSALAFVLFSRRAKRAIADLPDSELIPKPRAGRAPA
ncbi:MAG: hypothetical protein HYV07_30275 [Deltaproteobacteria bacterium]|nr:hypothetical protein [Deltaproteobacteria bacterium]